MRPRRTLAFALVAVVVAAAATWTRFRVDLDAARERLPSGSRIAATACGPIEYAERGAGPAVLLVHGAGGGYSQASDFAAHAAASGFRTIAMSRFGYLRTPLPRDASAAAQGDAHACLLDALALDDAAVVAISAGAPSAAQFCIRHPARCRALVLLVPAIPVPGRTRAQTTPPSPFMRFVVEDVLSSDFVLWLVTRARPEILVETALATPLEVYRASPAPERGRALALLHDIFPVSLRVAGLGNDVRVVNDPEPFALERIRAPTLAISVEDDRFDTYAGARHVAAQVPGARFIGYRSGGHVWLGHDAEVRREVFAFLRDPRVAREDGGPR